MEYGGWREGGGGIFGAERGHGYRAKAQGALAEHLAAGNRAVIKLGSFHAVMGVVAGCRAIFKVDQA